MVMQSEKWNMIVIKRRFYLSYIDVYNNKSDLINFHVIWVDRFKVKYLIAHASCILLIHIE